MVYGLIEDRVYSVSDERKQVNETRSGMTVYGFLHHNNATAHISLLIREFLTKNKTNDTPASIFARHGSV